MFLNFDFKIKDGGPVYLLGIGEINVNKCSNVYSPALWHLMG